MNDVDVEVADIDHGRHLEDVELARLHWCSRESSEEISRDRRSEWRQTENQGRKLGAGTVWRARKPSRSVPDFHIR